MLLDVGGTGAGRDTEMPLGLIGIVMLPRAAEMVLEVGRLIEVVVIPLGGGEIGPDDRLRSENIRFDFRFAVYSKKSG